MSEFSETDRSILKIAYAISALDGVVTQDELKVFRKIAESFPGFCAGDAITNSLFIDAIDIGDQLIALKRIYSDDEMLKALLSQTRKDRIAIKSSRSATRKAFIIWIAIAFADKNYSDVARKAIKALQLTFNNRFDLLSFAGTTITQTSLGLVFGGITGSVAAGALGKKENSKTLSESDQTISDEFLAEVEDILKTISSIQSQMQTCDKERCIELQKNYDELNATLHEMIVLEDK